MYDFSIQSRYNHNDNRLLTWPPPPHQVTLPWFALYLISILLAWSRAMFLLLTERVHIPMHSVVMMHIRTPMPQPKPIIMYWIVGSSQKWVVPLVVSAMVVEVMLKGSSDFVNDVVVLKHLSSIVKWNSSNNSNVTYSKKI